MKYTFLFILILTISIFGSNFYTNHKENDKEIFNKIYLNEIKNINKLNQNTDEYILSKELIKYIQNISICTLNILNKNSNDSFFDEVYINNCTVTIYQMLKFYFLMNYQIKQNIFNEYDAFIYNLLNNNLINKFVNENKMELLEFYSHLNVFLECSYQNYGIKTCQLEFNDLLTYGLKISNKIYEYL